MYILTIDDDTITDCLDRANVRYWASQYEDVPGGYYRVTEAEGFQRDGEWLPTTHLLTRAKIQAGLSRMLADAPANLAGILDPDKRDQNTGDALIQFALFGELKYG